MVPGCGPKQQRGAAGRPGEALPPSAPPSSVLEEAPLTELARCGHGSRPSAPPRMPKDQYLNIRKNFKFKMESVYTTDLLN